MKRFSRQFARVALALVAVANIPSARASDIPSQPFAELQTSGRSRGPGIGDWYTTATSASTDRVHRILVEVSQELLNANGGVVNVRVLDAENAGTNDELLGTPDPTRFEVRTLSGAVASPAQTVPSGAPDGTTLTFPLTAVGSYQLLSVDGAFPINGDATATLNDDDNSFRVSIPGNTTLVGQFQGNFSSSRASAGPFDLNFYFLVGPGQSNLRLRNFDLDRNAAGNPTVSYLRPSGTTFAGTNSVDGQWNGPSPTLNTGEDTVSVAAASPYLDAGQWGLNVSGIGGNNQFVLEANAGIDRLVLLDQPVGAADAGNFRITPDGILPGTINQPTDHLFSVTNFFFTNDIVNFSLSGTSPNFSAVLIDAATGNPLVDTDSDGTTAGGAKRVDTGVLLPGQTKNYILRVTPRVAVGPSDTTRVNGVSFMDERVVPGTTTTLFVNKTTQLSASTNVSGTIYNDANRNSALDNGEIGLPTSNFFVKLVPTAGGDAVAVASVNSSNGTYSLLNVTPGSYNLVLSNNNALNITAPVTPPNTAGTEAPTGIRAVVVPTAGAIEQNFGRFGGAVITGRVFRDDGTGGGIANNG
ncbi:MAG TPA: hypothetical protein VF627_10260, partial [Abditibacterium sp.]